jgi:type IV pilus assembly protein PilY1
LKESADSAGSVATREFPRAAANTPLAALFHLSGDGQAVAVVDGDGVLDVGYRGWELKNPAPTDGSSRYKIDYYGYFNSFACYSWQTDRFVPVAAAPNKTCSGQWSGDFLNYLTMSRMDALRRVLYGGWRHVDTNSETVLQGAFFPQDAHSWGKEYQNVARDGYDIRNYAPVGLPDDGRYHLFAVTTVTDTGQPFPNYTAPMFRVLQNSPYRVWNWLSIEGPVAGNYCFTSNNTRTLCVSGGGNQPRPAHPNNRAQFDAMETQYAIAQNRYGSDTVTSINCSSNNCNPHNADQNEFLTIFTGQIITAASGLASRYQFRVDGDDAIDFEIYNPNGSLFANSRAGCYGSRGFGACGGGELTGLLQLSASTTYTFKFRQEEGDGGEGYRLEFRTCTGTTAGTCSSTWNVLSTTAVSGVRMANTTRTTYDLTPPLPAATEAFGEPSRSGAPAMLTVPPSGR